MSSLKQTTNSTKTTDINFNEFENYTIITYNNSIVSFSSILQRDIWKKNTVRIFNSGETKNLSG